MNRARIAALVVLAAGNVLLWRPGIAAATSRSFDFARFQSHTRDLFPGSELSSKRLIDPLLPDTNLYLASTQGPLLTVYVGYYPAQGLLAKKPHRPEVCYQVHGWHLVCRPAPMIIEDNGRSFTIQTTTVGFGKHQRRVYDWRQQSGRLPDGPEEASSWTDRLERVVESGIADLAWVRVEVAADQVEDDALRTSLVQLMHAVAECMR